jgi:hypothetical protein
MKISCLEISNFVSIINMIMITIILNHIVLSKVPTGLYEPASPSINFDKLDHYLSQRGKSKLPEIPSTPQSEYQGVIMGKGKEKKDSPAEGSKMPESPECEQK